MRTKVYALTTALLLNTSALLAQASYDTLRVTYDGTKGGQFCNMTGATECYFYSGAGSTSPTFAWEHTIGHWGTDDGYGKMTSTGTDKWEIKIHIPTYYQDTTGLEVGSTPAPQGATIYKIGVVFQNGDGTKEGKDSTCNEFFIVYVNTDTVKAVDGNGSNFDGVKAEWVTPPSSVRDVTDLRDVTVAPNPSRGLVNVGLDVINPTELRVSVINSLGQEVAVLHDGTLAAGAHQLQWQGADVVGMYFIEVANASGTLTKRVMIAR